MPITSWGFPHGSLAKNSPANAGGIGKEGFSPLGQEDPLENGKANHFGILAWEIPRIEEPDGLQSMGLQIVRYD